LNHIIRLNFIPQRFSKLKGVFMHKGKKVRKKNRLKNYDYAENGWDFGENNMW